MCGGVDAGVPTQYQEQFLVGGGTSAHKSNHKEEVRPPSEPEVGGWVDGTAPDDAAVVCSWVLPEESIRLTKREVQNSFPEQPPI